MELIRAFITTEETREMHIFQHETTKEKEYLADVRVDRKNTIKTDLHVRCGSVD